MISTTKMLGFSVARRRTRRFLVAAYWCAITLLCHAFQHQYSSNGINYSCVSLVFSCIVFTGILGGVRGGGPVRAFRGVRWIPWSTTEPSDVYTPLDEREAWERDRMHFIAYTLVRWLTLLLFALYILFGAIHAEWLRVAGPLILFLITLMLWSLPQTLILWTEPDMEEAQ
jgi:hypothetical protein